MDEPVTPAAPMLPAPSPRRAIGPAEAHPGRGRLITASVLSVIAVVVTVPGLIDPVEGAIPILLAGMLLLAGWLIGRVRMPALAWIAWTLAFASGAATLFIVGMWPELTAQAPAGPFALPMAVLVPLVIYEVSVLATIVGAVWNASRVVRAAHRHHASA